MVKKDDKKDQENSKINQLTLNLSGNIISLMTNEYSNQVMIERKIFMKLTTENWRVLRARVNENMQ